MARQTEVTVPDIGDFESVDVVEVLVSPGDHVQKDDPLISLESDKATLDVPSPATGVVKALKVKVGDKVSEGSPVLELEVDGAAEEPTPPQKKGDGAKAAPAPKTETVDRTAPQALQPEPAEVSADQQETVTGAAAPKQTKPETPEAPEVAAPAEGYPAAPLAELDSLPPPPPRPVQQPPDREPIYASPAIRRTARELGVDLTQVQGSGPHHRITKEDVQGHVKQALRGPAPKGGEGLQLPALPQIDFAQFGEVERQPLTRIQRLSGPNLQRAWLHAPQVTQHGDADITELEAFRRSRLEEAKQRGFKLTPLAFVMKACVAALRAFPILNASLDPDGEHLVVKRHYHFGVAVDTAEGLVVPVVRDVDRKGVFELAEELATISEAARDRKLKREQIQGASFSISSLGGIGGSYFTPIVNVPEVAILGVSRAETKPVFRDDSFVPRLMLPVSLSYDHRVVDGATAARFVTHLSELLGDIRRILL